MAGYTIKGIRLEVVSAKLIDPHKGNKDRSKPFNTKDEDISSE
jgi:hypothetical protein